MSPDYDTILVVDLGAQYSRLIARRVRDAHVHSEIVPRSITALEVKKLQPAGIILSGGPASVYAEDAYEIDSALLDVGVPVLGICYGHQMIAHVLGGRVERTDSAEFGRTAMDADPGARLFRSLPRRQDVWMSHRDAVTVPPPGFRATASTAGSEVAAMEDVERGLAGVQFHPEVVHTEHGLDVLERFLFDICGARPTWTRSSIIEREVAAVERAVAGHSVLCALSGGVDSAVAAALVHKAVGDQLTCVFVDHGLLRAGEAEHVVATFGQGMNLVHIEAEERFLDALAGVADPEVKRRVIGETFIRVFEEVAADRGDARFLVQGTLYPDIIESGSTDAARIKSHHNVGGLPEDLRLELIEPLRDLFKDEVRSIGEELGLPEEIVWRQPFPGPGLAVRIVGEVTKERCDMLRAADAIVLEEVRRAGLYDELWQSFAVLPTIRTVGVQGDERTYAYPLVIRAVTSEDAMTADWARLPHGVLERISSRVINEVTGINRVVYDVTSKPPGTIEWE